MSQAGLIELRKTELLPGLLMLRRSLTACDDLKCGELW
jgi:hypothetical protein